MMFGRLLGILMLVASTSPELGGLSSAGTEAPPIDRVVALSKDRSIALHCAGQGTFTVLLEPGDGGHRAHMAPLFEALSERYRVCDYDRRNIGLSSSAPTPRKATDLQADLFDTLAASNVEGPYILFGSSMGGLLVRSYATSPKVAGFVTSNQPGTSSEWVKLAYPLMTSDQRQADAAWMAGANNERIDVNDVSRTIDQVGPPRVPYVIMISTERFQCKAAEICGRLYGAFAAASRRTAKAGRNGTLRIFAGDHDLYVSNLTDVIAAIDKVALAAARNH
jgi:pimeloyl-ACP methyl ester carboxylesterase